MKITVKKLSSDLLNDWLEFFDNVGFTDNEEWSGCYCMCYHWDKELEKIKPWRCTRTDAPVNRSCAIDFIKNGRMQGYLAYWDGKVAGWCNTNDKTAYAFSNPDSNLEEEEAGKKVKAIVCFCIAPEYRGKGVATHILEQVILDATTAGYDFIEAYPFINDAVHAYHGPQVMYEKHGFVYHSTMNNFNILRKYLK